MVMCRWDEGVGKWRRWVKNSVQTCSNLFLKTLTEGTVTTEAGRLFQYFPTFTKMPTLNFEWGGVPYRAADRKGGKTCLDQHSKGP